TCGPRSDGCGGTLQCGSCPSDQCLICGAGNTCVSGCPASQLCCDQLCVSGVCCTDAQCTDPTTPQCSTDHTCVCIPRSVGGSQPTCDPAPPEACCSGHCQPEGSSAPRCCDLSHASCDLHHPETCCSGTCSATTGCV